MFIVVSILKTFIYFKVRELYAALYQKHSVDCVIIKWVFFLCPHLMIKF